MSLLVKLRYGICLKEAWQWNYLAMVLKKKSCIQETLANFNISSLQVFLSLTLYLQGVLPYLLSGDV